VLLNEKKKKMSTDSLKEARLKFMSQHAMAMGTSNSNGSASTGVKKPEKKVLIL